MTGRDKPFFVVAESERPELRLARWKPVWEAVEAGKTVFVPAPDDHPDPKEWASRAGSGAYAVAKARGFRVTTRVRERHGAIGLFVWRVDDA